MTGQKRVFALDVPAMTNSDTALDHAFDRRQGVAAVAEQGVGGKANIPKIEIAGVSAAEPCEIAHSYPGREPSRFLIVIGPCCYFGK